MRDIAKLPPGSVVLLGKYRPVASTLEPWTLTRSAPETLVSLVSSAAQASS